MVLAILLRQKRVLHHLRVRLSLLQPRTKKVLAHYDRHKDVAQ
jgi:hypothetical protein